MKHHLLIALSASLLLNLAMADDHIGDIHVDHAHARATVPGQTSGAAYLTLENQGKGTDKLLSVSSPLAKSSAVHSMQMDGNVMRMREVGALELKPSARVVMGAGDGYHIMLEGLKQPLTPGATVPLSLRFEKAGKIDINIVVDPK